MSMKQIHRQLLGLSLDRAIKRPPPKRKSTSLSRESMEKKQPSSSKCTGWSIEFSVMGQRNPKGMYDRNMRIYIYIIMVHIYIYIFTPLDTPLYINQPRSFFSMTHMGSWKSCTSTKSPAFKLTCQVRPGSTANRAVQTPQACTLQQPTD